jgi:hypothetical protein
MKKEYKNFGSLGNIHYISKVIMRDNKMKQMEIVQNKIGNKTEVYLTNVPKLNDDVYSFLETLSISPKIEKLESGLYNLWIGSKSVKSFNVLSKEDDYKVISTFIKSILNGVDKNVWSEEQNEYVDVITVNESINLRGSNISKKINNNL